MFFFCKHLTLEYKRVCKLKALKNLKNGSKIAKMTKNGQHSCTKEKDVVINAQFRVQKAKNKFSYCVCLKILCLISIERDSAEKYLFETKKMLTVFRIQKLLSNCKANNAGTYVLKWFVFSSRQM